MGSNHSRTRKVNYFKKFLCLNSTHEPVCIVKFGFLFFDLNIFCNGYKKYSQNVVCKQIGTGLKKCTFGLNNFYDVNE